MKYFILVLFSFSAHADLSWNPSFLTQFESYGGKVIRTSSQYLKDYQSSTEKEITLSTPLNGYDSTQINRLADAGWTFLYFGKASEINPEWLSEHRSQVVIGLIDPLSQYNSDYINQYVNDGGKVIVSCKAASINSDWVWEHVGSITMNLLSPLSQYNSDAINEMVSKNVPIIYSGTASSANGQWFIDNAKHVTINEF